MLGLFAWGVLADRIGERRVIAVGLTGAAGAFALASQLEDFAAAVTALLVAGLLGSAATAASARAVMGWFDREERGLALGIRQMSVPLAGGIAALTLPPIALAGGVEAALLALAAGCLAGALAAMLIREAPPVPANFPPVGAPRPQRDPRIWRLAGGTGLMVMAQISIVAFVVLYLHDEHGLSVTEAGIVLGAIQLLGAFSRVLVGWWSDRLRRRVPPIRQIALATTIALLASAALTGAPVAVTVAALGLAGILSMSWNGLAFTAAAEMAGRAQTGAAIGLHNTVLFASGSAATILFGILVTATSWPAAFALLALLPLAGALVLRPLVAEEERRRIERDRLLRDAGLGPAPAPAT
jgi:sugar phosphate permease